MPFRSGFRSILRNSWHLGTARALASGSRAVYSIFLARELGALLYGHFNYGMAWYLALMPLSFLGIQWVLLKEIGTNPESAPGLVFHTLRIRLTASLLLGLSSIMAAWMVEPDPDMRVLLTIFSVALMVRSMAFWFQPIFTARDKSRYVLILESTFRLAEVFIGIFLLFSGAGIFALAILHVAAWSIQLGVSALLLRNLVPATNQRFEWGEVVRILKRGFPFLIAGVLGTWMLQGMLILYRFQGGLDQELGFVALTLQAFSILGTIMGELGNAALPVVARSIHRADGKSDRYVQEVLRVGCFLGATLSVGAFAFGRPVTHWVLGDSYAPVALLLPWAMATLTFHFWMTALQGMIGVHEHFKAVIGANALGALLFTIGFFLLHPILGIPGAILAMGTGLFSVTIVYMRLLSRHHEIDWKHRLLGPGISALGGIGTAWYIQEAGPLVTLSSGFLTMALIALTTRSVTLSEVRRVFFRKL